MANTTYVTNATVRQELFERWLKGDKLRGFDLLAARDHAASVNMPESVAKLNAELARTSQRINKF